MKKMLMRVVFSLILIATIELAALVLALAVGGTGALLRFGFRPVFLKALWLLALPPVVILYGMFIGREGCRVREVELTSPHIPVSFSGYRIVQISDLHLQSYRTKRHSLSKVVKKVNSLEPDLILFTGDLVTLSLSEVKGMESMLGGFFAKEGVLSVLGNHDCFYLQKGSDSSATEARITELVAFEQAMGWRPLLNECVNITRASDTISVVGVYNTSDNNLFPSRGDLSAALEGACGSYKILMSHDPTHWRKEVAADERVDIMLSGHTHEAQARVFGFSPAILLYKQHNGLYMGPGQENEARCVNAFLTIEDEPACNLLYVNIGLGETGLPARIGARPEVTLFTLAPLQR